MDQLAAIEERQRSCERKVTRSKHRADLDALTASKRMLRKDAEKPSFMTIAFGSPEPSDSKKLKQEAYRKELELLTEQNRVRK